MISSVIKMRLRSMLAWLPYEYATEYFDCVTHIWEKALFYEINLKTV